MAAYSQLEPQAVWAFFAGIAAVPRPSKHEQRIRQHVADVAGKHGLKVREDHVGNLLIDVPASAGHEKAPITVLQAHLDMVCEKNAATKHDFSREGIRLVVDKDAATGEPIVRAEGTTLGADNGIGVALALAAATSPGVVHGPLELLLTVDEEDGMSGAKGLTRDSFRGRRMLNLDSEEDDTLYIGCAGGSDISLSWTLAQSPLPGDAETGQVVVSGLRGGHSGGEIHEGRGNAIKLLVRTLLRSKVSGLQLVDIAGGSKRNAIPREAAATVAGQAGTLASLRSAAAEVAGEAAAESYEAGVSIRAERGAGAPAAFGAKETTHLLLGLTALPSGVLGMHPKIAGLVETSNNVSTITTKLQAGGAVVEVGLLPRSSSASRMRETLDQLAAIGRLAGARPEIGNTYPGWSPNPNSPTLAICRRVYQEQFGHEPKVTAIHAGLECGIIGEQVGGMDMVSLGPTIRGAHSPDERVYTQSVERTWRYLVSLLGALART